MVVDLQGAPLSRSGEFVLTDPAILCTDLMRFGDTNMGAEAIARSVKSARALLDRDRV